VGCSPCFPSGRFTAPVIAATVLCRLVPRGRWGHTSGRRVSCRLGDDRGVSDDLATRQTIRHPGRAVKAKTTRCSVAACRATTTCSDGLIHEGELLIHVPGAVVHLVQGGFHGGGVACPRSVAGLSTRRPHERAFGLAGRGRDGRGARAPECGHIVTRGRLASVRGGGTVSGPRARPIPRSGLGAKSAVRRPNGTRPSANGLGMKIWPQSGHLGTRVVVRTSRPER
jgi:hypothetical protein